MKDLPSKAGPKTESKTKMTKAKNIGVDVKPPKNTCTDQKCPFHGSLKLRGRTIVCTVIEADMHNSCSVEWPSTHYVKKVFYFLFSIWKVLIKRIHVKKILFGI